MRCTPAVGGGNSVMEFIRPTDYSKDIWLQAMRRDAEANQMRANILPSMGNSIMNILSGIGHGMRARTENRQKLETLLMGKGTIDENTPGIPMAGGWQQGSTGVPLEKLYPEAGFTPGRVFKKKEDEGILTEQEMTLLSNATGIDRKEFARVHRDVAKLVMPQYFLDPTTGKTTQVKPGTKALPVTPEKLPTEGERLTRGFADRAQQADDELKTLMSGGYDPSALFSSRGEYVPNFLKSEKDQQAEQSMRNFVSAVLRKESGAAIPPAELATETIKYFPMRGDKPAVIAQKERTRAQAIRNLAAGSGKAPSTYKKAAGEPAAASGISTGLPSGKAKRLAELRSKLGKKAAP